MTFRTNANRKAFFAKKGTSKDSKDLSTKAIKTTTEWEVNGGFEGLLQGKLKRKIETFKVDPRAKMSINSDKE